MFHIWLLVLHLYFKSSSVCSLYICHIYDFTVIQPCVLTLLYLLGAFVIADVVMHQ